LNERGVHTPLNSEGQKGFKTMLSFTVAGPTFSLHGFIGEGQKTWNVQIQDTLQEYEASHELTPVQTAAIVALVLAKGQELPGNEELKKIDREVLSEMHF
jgi:hypothetical protein